MPLVITRRAICSYVGENQNDFKYLIDAKSLPAWRTKANGTWKARKVDLNHWIDLQAIEQLGDGCVQVQ